MTVKPFETVSNLTDDSSRGETVQSSKELRLLLASAFLCVIINNGGFRCGIQLYLVEYQVDHESFSTTLFHTLSRLSDFLLRKALRLSQQLFSLISIFGVKSAGPPDSFTPSLLRSTSPRRLSTKKSLASQRRLAARHEIHQTIPDLTFRARNAICFPALL